MSLGLVRTPEHAVMGATPTASKPTAPQRAHETPTRPIPGTLSEISVLITDEHYKSTLGLVRHLGGMGARVTVVAASKSSLACRSHHCKGIVRADSSTPQAFVAATLWAIRQNRYDLILPVSYTMTRELSRRKSELLRFSSLEVCDLDLIERAANKTSMTELAQHVGVPVPNTTVSSGLSDALRFARNSGYPLVLKPQCETPGRSAHIVRDRNELEAIFSKEFGGANGSANQPLLQEFIPGRGYGFFATYQNGVCKRIFIHRRVREYPSSGGVSSCAESLYDPHLEEFGRRMLDALGWHGVAMVEFRRDSRDGKYKLMEINPKFWGSLDLALAAGADFPGDLCRMAAGETLVFSDKYERGLRFHWPFSTSGDLFHLWSRPRSFLGVALDFLNPRVKSNLRLDDPGPTLLELRLVGERLLRWNRR